MSEHVDQVKSEELPRNLDESLRRVVEEIGLSDLVEQSPYMIGLCGPSSSGKSTIGRRLSEALPNATVIGMDRYLSERLWDQTRIFNHDSPDPNRPYVGGISPEIWDMKRMAQDLGSIARGLTVEMPIFSEQKKDRIGYETFTPGRFVVVEGGHTFSDPFVEMTEYKILVDAPLHDRLVRKLFRTCVQYGLDEGDEVISRYLRRDEPVHRHYFAERKEMADVIIDNPLSARVEFQRRQDLGEFPKAIAAFQLIPFETTGVPKSGESLRLYRNNDQEMLSFWLDGDPIVNTSITPSTHDLLLEHYEESSL